MSEADFTKPRSLGTVNKAKITSLRMNVTDDQGNGRVTIVVEEGEQVDETFDVALRETMEIQFSDLNTAEQNKVNTVLKMLLQRYVTQKGYSDVVVN